jgi:two-component system phosphate regulon sensor histidine kinase PhoR
MCRKHEETSLPSNDTDTEHRHREKFLSLFRCSPDAIFLTRASDGLILDVNEAYERLTGYQREEVLGRSAAQTGFWLEPGMWDCVARELEAAGELYGLDSRVLRKDGRLVNVEIALSRLDIDGEVCYLATTRDITARQQAQEAAREREEALQARLDNLLSPDVDISGEEVRRIIDFQSLQELMELFYNATKIGIGIIDIKGNILVAVGWQEICTKFHRQHPQALANCIESDIHLSNPAGGKYTLYKCKNNLWDMATPIIVGGRHIANIFLGQFFFADEMPDYEVFRRQAAAYGFDTEEYLAALERVPRWSRETVYAVMEFYTHLARIIAKLSYQNLRLAKALLEKERAEQAVQESEHKFATVFQSAPTLLAITSLADGRYIEVNEAFERFCGYRRDEVIGHSALELGIWKSPQDRAAILTMLREKGKVRDTEITYRDKGGKSYTGLFSGECIEIGGEQCLLSLVVDISERKRVEEAVQDQFEQLRTIFDSIDAIVYVADMESHELLYLNRYGSSLFGSDWKGKACFEVLPAGEGKSCSSCNRDRLVQDGKPQPSRTWEFRNSVSGRWFHCMDRAITWTDDHLVRLEIAFDITEIKEMAQMKDEVLSAVSHEMRTPLTAVLGYTELLLADQVPSGEEKRFIATIQHEAQRLNDLVKNFLDLQRLKARREAMNFESLAVLPLLEETAALFYGLSPRHHFTIDVPSDLVVRGNAGDLRQVFNNLVSNAVKYSPQGGEVHIGAHRESGSVLIQIQDQGIGIPAEAREKIFDQFYRLDNDDRRSTGGAGVGLTLVREIVNAHGGRVWVTANAGGGSIFHVRLP